MAPENPEHAFREFPNRLPGHVEALEFARIRVVDGESRGGRVVEGVRHRVTFWVARIGDFRLSFLISIEISRPVPEKCAAFLRRSQ
jgi:hypothetical protein